MEILINVFKGLLLVTGSLFLLVIIYAIITAPIQKRIRRKKTEKLVAVLDKITKEAIEELKKAEEAKTIEEKTKKQPKKTTKKTTKTKTKKEEK